MKLQLKILIATVPLVALPILLLGLISYQRLYALSQQRIMQQMDTTLEQVELHVSSELSTTRANIELFSGSELLRRYLLADEDDRYDLWQAPLLKQFMGYVKAYPAYYEIRVLLPKGELSSARRREHVSLYRGAENCHA